RSSCWVRVAMPSAGAAWGHQFIPRIGQEVLIDFIEGDIDRPVVTGVLYNGSHNPPAFSSAGNLPGNKTLSGIKSKEHQGQGHNELLFDDTPNQVRSRLASSHGATQLNQGFLTHPRADGKAEPRGEGFELRTDQHGAVRAAHGLLLSTEAQQGAAGKQLARTHAQSQLDAALALSQSLGEVATAQLADSIDSEPQKALDGHAKAWESGKQPILVASAPAGIASLTEQSQTLGAGTNLDLVAQRDLNHTAGRRWLANVNQHLSLFVAGVKGAVSLKLIAGQGKAQVQAQHGEMEWTASQDVTITSSKDRIVIAAQQEILLNVGGGAYIRLAGGNIDVHCPGKVSIKGASHEMDGPASMNTTHPSFPDNTPTVPLTLKLAQGPMSNQRALTHMPYTLYADGAQVDQGVIAEDSQLHIKHKVGTQKYTLKLANGLTYQIPIVNEYAGEEGAGALANQGFINHKKGTVQDVTQMDTHARGFYHRLLANDKENG
ncbi:DUF2345 domain-containing protein, partial [Paludibacterium purpuratum]